MSENRYTPHNGGRGGDATQNNEHPSRKTPDELLDEMADKWDAMDASNFDPQIVDTYLSELDIKDPSVTDINVEASLSAFREKHAHLFEQIEPVIIPDMKPRNRRGRRLRVIRLIAATVAVMLGCMITAQALGLDVFGTIARWTDDIFHFSAPAQVNSQVSTSPASSECSSLQEALQTYGITENIAPTWYPPDFLLSTVKIIPAQGSVKFQAAYENGMKFLSITVWQMESAEEASNVVFEKDAKDVILYERNGVKFYIMSNNEQTTAAWTVKNYMCSLSGEISEDETEKMINSIYER